MNTGLLVLCYCCLQAAFIWARFIVFRIVRPAPLGVRVIEVSTLLCMGAGIVLMAGRAGRSAAWDGVALATACASAAVFGWALASVRRRQLSAAFSTDQPVELLRCGAFGFVRNPFYLAYLLAHALPLLVSRSAWALLPLAWMGTLYVHAVRREERKFMSSPLAADWLRYAQATGRFVPRLRLPRKRERGLT